MDVHDPAPASAGGEATRTVARTRWGRRSPGGLFWLALLLIPLLFALLATCTGRGGIQDDLTTRSLAALDAQGVKGADVSFDGRDGTLTLPEGADAAAAKDAVAGVTGVRTVDVAGDAAGDGAAAAGPAEGEGDAAAPYSLAFGKDQVVVEATVGSDDDKAALLEAATAQAKGKKVVDKVTVEDGATGPDANALGTLGAGLAAHPGTKAAWDGSRLTLTGQVPSEDVKTTLGQQAQELATASKEAATVENLLVVKDTGAAGADDAPAVCGRLDDALAAVQEQGKIQFAESSPQLTSGSRAAVRQVAGLLAKCGDARVEVGGHTDNQGDPSTSQPLSQARAKAVRAALIELGVDGARITARGYGEAKPIASNDTEDGRAANRRVEITVK